MIELPTKSGLPYVLDAMAFKEIQDAYPGKDLEMELRKMRQWLLANPKRRKTNTHKFILNWLSKAPAAVAHPSHKAFASEKPMPRAPEHVVKNELEKIRKMGI